jgi:hypothetical protein
VPKKTTGVGAGNAEALKIYERKQEENSEGLRQRTRRNSLRR